MDSLTRIRFESTTLMRLLELAIVIALTETVSRLVQWAAGQAGVVLPDMPLLKHTYLFFLFILGLFVYLKIKGEPLAQFGFVRPRLGDLWRGLLVFAIIVAFGMLVQPYLEDGVAAVTGASKTLAAQHFAAVKGNLPLCVYFIGFAWLFGAFGEELLYRGYIMTRLAQVFGEDRNAWLLANLLQAILFALGHWYQGPVGMVPSFFGALLTGAATVVWGRTLWPAIIAHGLQDTLGIYVLYAGASH